MHCTTPTLLAEMRFPTFHHSPPNGRFGRRNLTEMVECARVGSVAGVGAGLTLFAGRRQNVAADQPGVYRIDAGPRLTMRVRRNVKVHIDWRQRLSGNALPGPAVTLAGDF
jgi:hypothetical protein